MKDIEKISYEFLLFGNCKKRDDVLMEMVESVYSPIQEKYQMWQERMAMCDKEQSIEYLKKEYNLLPYTKRKYLVI